jgi:hypothetical protein
LVKTLFLLLPSFECPIQERKRERERTKRKVIKKYFGSNLEEFIVEHRIQFHYGNKKL